MKSMNTSTTLPNSKFGTLISNQLDWKSMADCMTTKESRFDTDRFFIFKDILKTLCTPGKYTH